jgi:hypothetical protein
MAQYHTFKFDIPVHEQVVGQGKGEFLLCGLMSLLASWLKGMRMEIERLITFLALYLSISRAHAPGW